jgi:hypothetical protein
MSYKKHIKELRELARECGYTVRLYQKPCKFSKARGYCDKRTKTIHVFNVKKGKKSGTIHALAHEVRHAIHDKYNLFSRAYVNNKKDLRRLSDVSRQLNRMCPQESYDAEVDCDLWAYRWIIDRGYIVRQVRIYPKNQTVYNRLSKFKRWLQS